jgi:hypothetical protein
MDEARENYFKKLREYRQDREKYIEPKLQRASEARKLAQEWHYLE